MSKNAVAPSPRYKTEKHELNHVIQFALAIDHCIRYKHLITSSHKSENSLPCNFPKQKFLKISLIKLFSLKVVRLD